jgi:hypothetical protein
MLNEFFILVIQQKERATLCVQQLHATTQYGVDGLAKITHVIHSLTDFVDDRQFSDLACQFVVLFAQRNKLLDQSGKSPLHRNHETNWHHFPDDVEIEQNYTDDSPQSRNAERYKIGYQTMAFPEKISDTQSKNENEGYRHFDRRTMQKSLA